MIHFINNIGDYFASNYFDDGFSKKVIEKSGYSHEAIKEINKKMAGIKPHYFKLKQQFIENHLRPKDKVNLTHDFHTKILNALGYDGHQNNYDELFPITDNTVIPVRQILYRGDKPHLMVMEMHAMIKRTAEDQPEGLFEQSYVSDEENGAEKSTKEQKYHRSQWADIFTVPEGMHISPMIINQAVGQIFLLDEYRRPKYILLCAGNQYYLLESENWFRGSYLELDLEALFDDAATNKNDYSVFYLLLGKELLAPTADIVLMESLEEDAHKAAYEVTKDLKEGVIHAVERLANEAVVDLVKQGKQYEDINADWLKEDCLNMVYRLLFLFYAESREDLAILPANDEVYEHGYSLEMLRELEQVPLITESSINGYFFHKSLFQLFDLLHTGYREHWATNKSFKIKHLDSPMFDPKGLHYLNNVKIRNIVWQDVICELSLSKKQQKKGRGRISYANLGINQLGSVYESLLAFRGVLAAVDNIEVHRKKKKNETSEQVVSNDGSFLVPRSRLDEFDHDEIYYKEMADGSEQLKVIPKGSFIYRLNGRDRQKSASYYTPEVLTQTTVKYTLKPILEKLEKGEIKALDLLDLKILEPAMGAAAFHNEVINQLAQAYLTNRQKELKKKIDPNQYQQETQKVKAYIALNNVYGVDINPTAVELGKLSLWLNVIHKDMQTPFFGYRLGEGNAVVGSWLKAYKVKEFSIEPTGTTKKGNTYVKKQWWTKKPEHLKFGKKGILRDEDQIYHFLLPDEDMASSANIKLLKEAYPNKSKRLIERRRDFVQPLDADEINKLKKIANAIDALLIAHYNIQRDIAFITKSNAVFFGSEDIAYKMLDSYSYQQKKEFADNRLKPNAPYYKLKQIMDYWCSLWFWDVRSAEDFPTRAEWYNDLIQILNLDLDNIHLTETVQLIDDEDHIKDYRKDKKSIVKQLAEALKQSSTSLFTNQRAQLIQKYAAQYKFFHYELEFIEVFVDRKGFDVAVGNPPWLKIQFEEKDLMSEIYPELEIRKISAPKVKKLQAKFLENSSRQDLYFTENIENDASAVFLNAFQNYPLLKGQQTNLYKCVLENGLHWINKEGYLGLIHPEGIYDDPKGYALREEVYKRLRYHFQFLNVKRLFHEILHWNVYGINIYAGILSIQRFYSINNLFHPATIEGCFIENQTAALEPVQGIKIKDSATGNFVWNTKPHPSRKVLIDEEVLKILAATFENSKNWQGAKLVSIHAKGIVDIIKKIGEFPGKVSDIENKISEGWHETNDVTAGFIQRDTKYPDFSKYEMIYSGPHLFVGNPMYKTPREICDKPHDYDIIDLTKITKDSVARTNYTPVNVAAGYGSIIKGFEDENGNYDNWLGYYKVAFRAMLSQAGERTLSGAIIPPKSSHIHGVKSITFKNEKMLVEFSAISSSLVIDFFIKTIGKAGLYDNSQFLNLPLNINNNYNSALYVRTLLLNCLNTHYAKLWEENFDPVFTKDTWAIEDNRLKPFSALSKTWSWDTPLRNYFERRMALVEIDVITAIALGLSLEELILMYNIQFPVLQQNEDDTWYDCKGNIVYTCNNQGLKGVGVDGPDWEKIKDLKAGEAYEHTITKSELYNGKKIIYYAPFTKCDRVEDYKRAWTHFESRL